MSEAADRSPPSAAGDMLFGTGARILYALTRVALPPLALAHVGPTEYGLWAACFVLVGYLGMAASGFTLVYLRGVARHHARGDVAAIGRLMSTGMLAMAAVALGLMGLLWLSMPGLLALFRVEPAHRELASLLWLGACAVFLADMSLGAFANVLHAMGRIRQEQSVWIGAFVLETLLIVAFFHAGWGVRGLLAAFALRHCFSAAMAAWLVHRACPALQLSSRQFDRSLLRHFFGYGSGVQACGLLGAALQSSDRLLAGALIGPHATALVDLAGKLPVTASSVASGASGVAVSASARDDARRAAGVPPGAGVYLDAMRVTVASLGAMLPFMALFAPLLTQAWLGPSADQAAVAQVMAWLSIGLHLHMLTGPATAVIRGRGSLRVDLGYHALRAATLAVTVGVWWAPDRGGLVALAQALAVSQGAAALVCLVVLHRHLCGGWAGLLPRILLPTAAAYALAALLAGLLSVDAVGAAWAVPTDAGRRVALPALAGLAAVWAPAVGVLGGLLLFVRDERLALARRLVGRRWRPLSWRQT